MALISIMHWNIKYANPNKDYNAEKYKRIAITIAKEMPDVVVLTEVTSKADDTKSAIVALLNELRAPFSDAALYCQHINVGGGNNEHHMFLVNNVSGYKISKARLLPHARGAGGRDRKFQVGGGTRGIGLINLSHSSFPANTFIRVLSAHPSPCGPTSTAAAEQAQGVVTGKSVSKKPNKNIVFSFMVGDFNTESDGDEAAAATIEKSGMKTHSSGKEIDFSVHDGAIEEVVTTVGRIREGVSDHAFQNYLVKY